MMIETGAQIVLASSSPRRRQLLDQIGVRYRVISVDADERRLAEETPTAYVMRMAAEKSRLGRRQSEALDCGLPVLAADTAVVLDGEVLGKPRDRAHALAMLARLSGRTHQVLSAVSVRAAAHRQDLNVTSVAFREISAEESLAYWATGEPQDKAGGYAVQGVGALFVARIEGSFSGVMGLPLFETARLLIESGVPLLPAVYDGNERNDR